MPQNWQNVSVTLKYRDQIGRNTSKITPRLISAVFSVCSDHNIMDLLQREHHKISAETGIRQITCYIRNIDSHSNLLLNSLFCFVKFVWLALANVPKRIASASHGFLEAARLSCTVRQLLSARQYNGSSLSVVVEYNFNKTDLQSCGFHQTLWKCGQSEPQNNKPRDRQTRRLTIVA